MCCRQWLLQMQKDFLTAFHCCFSFLSKVRFLQEMFEISLSLGPVFLKPGLTSQ